jgi:hypothetical protein
MSLMSDALKFHADALNEAAGECITYIRGSDSITITAVPSESTFDAETMDGSTIEYKTQDFIVKQQDLDFGSGATAPSRRDKIERTVNGVTLFYDVLPDFGIANHRDSNGRGISYRISTKQKGD